MESLKNKNVLIISATGGIGSKTTQLLSGSGANIFLAVRNAYKLSALAAQHNVSVERTLVLDICKPEEVVLLKEKFFAAFLKLIY